ncbi:hypothetical protein R3P38DRAFT_3323885 [Favolaschia claudopus]|uniref:3'-5' exonuclease n=1 Tax=Favolaschia claudopus TaxID=2862362 RepID=A0AAW0AIL8_9AGAR
MQATTVIPPKRGRPKGSKDGPRAPDAPPRGRPSRKAILEKAKGKGPTQTVPASAESDADDEYDFDDHGDISLDQWQALDKDIEETYGSTQNTTPTPPACKPTLTQLRTAAKHSQKQPFFTPNPNFGGGSDSDESDLESQDGADEDTEGNKNETDIKKPWFIQPKYMPNWLYRYFHHVIRPLVLRKEGNALAQPITFTSSFPSFWIYPPEPVFALTDHKFDPPTMYRPRVFLWLPHFFVSRMNCPDCGSKLEKNGALRPRRVVDVDDVFYIVSWAYYCRDSCKHHFHGWSRKILDSLPAYLRLAFPAVLSRKSGLSRNVVNQLRVGNQHKMGPSGVRALLLESHTLRFSTLQAQYLEAVFEMIRGRQQGQTGSQQPKIDSFLTERIPSFGDFGDHDGYAGFVPTEGYLASMLNKAIEADEDDANQHTACQRPDNLAIDDSHKINKHIAKVDGLPIFGALWTCMDSRGIRAQALTLTKSHEERIGPLSGIAQSARLYGFDDPLVVFSDDPIKDKSLVYSAFPSLAENLAPPPSSSGLESLCIPPHFRVQFLTDASSVDKILSSITAQLDDDPELHLCLSVDAEWNISRKLGISHLKVHRFASLPTSLLRLLISNRVFKIGSRIQGDFTRMKKQFPALKGSDSSNLIDLKTYSVQRGVIGRQDAGSLDTLVEKVLGQFLPKDAAIRKSDAWESKILPPGFQDYAALDVYASRRVFEKVTQIAPLETVKDDTPPGTRVALLVQEGGEVAAYGQISGVQSSSFQGIRVSIPSRTRVIVEIDDLILPSVVAILHALPTTAETRSRRAKSGSYTLGQLKELSMSSTFSIVSPVHLLKFDRRSTDEITSQHSERLRRAEASSSDRNLPLEFDMEADKGADTAEDSEPDDSLLTEEAAHNEKFTEILEAHSSTQANLANATIDVSKDLSIVAPAASDDNIIATLRQILNTPFVPEPELTRLKKDIFHAFHMLSLNEHPLRARFCSALRDHVFIWDPAARKNVDEVCRQYFKMDFDTMLSRNAEWIKRRVPRLVPPPRLLVPALEHVFNSYGHASDAESGRELFSPTTWQKANSVVELARLGYLSDLQGVPMYRKDGIDQYGLQKWRSERGTNRVEGGPHSDIYRKFGALHAGPRLTVNCLTDHRVWYNLQAFAKHVFNVDWEYHHSLSLINRVSFLLNYLSGIVNGADSYAEWLNPDLYERTTEKFGICPVPESLRLRFNMEPYNEQTATRFKLKGSNDWLRQRQAVALPILPPSTPTAHQFYFRELPRFISSEANGKKRRVDNLGFTQHWNSTADGKSRFYITVEILEAYAKIWAKSNNSRASEELNMDRVKRVEETQKVLATPNFSFPDFLTGISQSVQPSRGVLEVDSSAELVPASISTTYSESNIDPQLSNLQFLTAVTQTDGEPSAPPRKRRRITERKRETLRSCRRCRSSECKGAGGIFNCPIVCTVPCKTCNRLTGCRGVDDGKACTYNTDHAKKSAWEK